MKIHQFLGNWELAEEKFVLVPGGFYKKDIEM
jgi:hypothetical protein